MDEQTQDIKISYEDFQKIDLRVAEIIEAAEHPNADRLFVLKIKIGEETRQIVAGIRASYKKEELIGRKIAVITNLQPAVIRGQESCGMLLAASGENGPIILTPEKDVPSGSKIK
ncbi:MAG TPA: methionine--tRNA ligase subunit beta [Candidatus Omnitrophota bacterium]|nr:methionine--tRNA ligase subunit beta [Candidatus Omnitrophota bacterium]HPS20842.1 methionine--tRNA ligase subunit beta [Candidatus Omnitrophota bacterium]